MCVYVCKCVEYECVSVQNMSVYVCKCVKYECVSVQNISVLVNLSIKKYKNYSLRQLVIRKLTTLRYMLIFAILKVSNKLLIMRDRSIWVNVNPQMLCIITCIPYCIFREQAPRNLALSSNFSPIFFYNSRSKKNLFSILVLFI